MLSSTSHVLFQLTLLHCAFVKYDDTIGLITICPPNIDHGSLTIVIKFSIITKLNIFSFICKLYQYKYIPVQNITVNISDHGSMEKEKYGCIKIKLKNIIELF